MRTVEMIILLAVVSNTVALVRFWQLGRKEVSVPQQLLALEREIGKHENTIRGLVRERDVERRLRAAAESGERLFSEENALLKKENANLKAQICVKEENES